MLFNSFQFFNFLAVVYLLYLILPHKWQNRMLVAASYFFYCAWDWRFLSLLLISTFIDFFCGIKISNSKNTKIRKSFLILSIVVNLGLLFLFKYFNFFAENLQNLLNIFGFAPRINVLKIILPIGISFYTFQTLSYTFDVYRNKILATKNLFDFCLFVCFFPQLVAGPIERAENLLPQIENPRTIKFDEIKKGLHFIFWGLFLKIFVADNLANNIVDPFFASAFPYNGVMVLLTSYAFSFQLYCDFAGYSFIAVGIASLMGISLIHNFERPFYAPDISEFWRRWHISLSSWFRDYVFYPFYGFVENKIKLKNFGFKGRHNLIFLITVVITEILLGFWHGAAWKFGLFGLYHGLLIWGFYFFRNTWNKMNILIRIFLTFQLVALGVIIFRANSLEQIIQMLSGLFFNFDFSSSNTKSIIKLLIFYTSIPVLVEGFQDINKDTNSIFKINIFLKIIFYSLCALLMISFGHSARIPFIYFQF